MSLLLTLSKKLVVLRKQRLLKFYSVSDRFRATKLSERNKEKKKWERLWHIKYVACNLKKELLYRVRVSKIDSPAKHQRPVARAKITRKIMSTSTMTPTTIPMMDPASKSTPANGAKKERLSLSCFPCYISVSDRH